jgi:hypothetical protein
MHHSKNNQRMRPIKFLLIGLLPILFLGSCKKYLNLRPVGKYIGPEVFSNENAINQALYGLYNNMATDSLYGAALSATTIEMLAQQWYSQSSVYGEIAQYQYTNAQVQPAFENIWQTAYADILNANVVIQGIDEAIAGGVVNTTHGNQMKGEALAIRAMLHFDLLRTFGPVMSTNAGDPAIPYYTQPDGHIQPILTGTQTLDSVLADLTKAESLLSADPVITGGPNVAAYATSADFYAGSRNQRLNYYAVKALMARAYLWGGLNSAAHDSALAVINGASQWFPWRPVGNGVNNPDHIFSTEILFGVYNKEMYTNYNILFLPSVPATAGLFQIKNTLAGTFENNEDDYRYLGTWQNGVSYTYFYKYAPPADLTSNWQYVQPLIRKTEMYYIVAETDPDPAVGIAYMDTVRQNRGLQPLDPTVVLSTEIRKEYQKEFMGEGQLFYYYKRTNVASLSSPFAIYYPYTVTPAYKVPLPLSETSLR